MVIGSIILLICVTVFASLSPQWLATIILLCFVGVLVYVMCLGMRQQALAILVLLNLAVLVVVESVVKLKPIIEKLLN